MKIIKHLATCMVLALVCCAASCKKNDNPGNDPETPPAASSTGRAIFYLKQDCNLGNVLVTINGVTKKIKDYSSYKPDCDADSSYASFKLDPGTYTYQATGETSTSLNWNGSISVSANGCAGMQLTCNNVTPQLKGFAGYPRLNLQHSGGVDFDLHIIGPDNVEINSFNTTGSGGKLDLQSSCVGDDTNYGFTGLTSTIENIWYPQGKAMKGTYKFWVQYGTYCNQPVNGTYTLRLLNGMSVVKTYTGTLTPTATKSAVYSITY